jgi:hypothetical protein
MTNHKTRGEEIGNYPRSEGQTDMLLERKKSDRVKPISTEEGTDINYQ